MSRDSKVYLSDIREAIAKIMRYTTGLTLQAFSQDAKTFDAVVRNLEIIGEAAKNMPEDTRAKLPGVEWKKMSGLRDILAHQYFGVDAEIIWDIVQNKLPTLERQLQHFS